MKTLYVKNSQMLIDKLDEYADGTYWVTKKIEGHRVYIVKPGVKKDSPRDIAVSIQYPDGKEKTPSHRLLGSDFRKKCEFDMKLARDIFRDLKLLQAGKDPKGHYCKNDAPGLPSEILVHSLKWVWIQEDRNYPPPRLQGRRMNWSTYLLYWHGDIDLHSKEGEAFLKKYGYTDNEIFNIRHRSGGKNLR